jgi:uncharacterized Zn finger protein
MIKTIIHCDKCNSDNVLHELKATPVQEEHYTMKEFIEKKSKPSMQYGGYYYTQYILLCKECGHKSEYYV